jgi:hypothetical protein
MTTLTPDRAVTRETAALYRRRALVVRLHPRHMEIREKGRRDVLCVAYDTVYEFALKLRWRQAQAEKKAARRKP